MTPRQKNTLHAIWIIAAVVGLAVLSLTLVGCASSPVDRWYQSASLVAGVNDTVADLHEVGQLTTEDVAIELRPWLDTMNGSLDRAHDRLPEGGDSFDTMLDVLDASRESILTYLRTKQEMN